MKRIMMHKLNLLLLLVCGPNCFIYAYQAVTPSGHIIYWQNAGSGSDKYAIVYPPNTYTIGNQDVNSPDANYESWSGYSNQVDG